jgi:hypothetical protein
MTEPTPPLSRDQRIEELLLAGLDRYFAGELERAIQVWSRVFFLDRGHARARAYIDRARGAMAERQREAEARWHRAHGAGGGSGELGVIATSRLAEAAETGALPESFTSAAPTPGLATGIAATALAHAPVVESSVELLAQPERPRSNAGREDERAARPRVIAQVLLVALAALLLFGAGYVVAARDRLAAWWGPSSAPALSVPAMAPESGSAPRPQQTPGPSTPPRGTATR